MADLVYVGCRLPHGLHLDLPGDGETKRRITLLGANKSRVINGAGVTPVPKDFWDEWYPKFKDAKFVKNGAVYQTRNAADAEIEGDRRSKDTTGFEGANPKGVDKALAELAR